MGVNYYDRLGVSWDASLEEIRLAYFNAARRYHPDVNPDPHARTQFLKIQEAYDVLVNPKLREEFNITLPPEAKFSPAVNLNIYYSRSSIPRLDEPQLVYALCVLNCKENVTISDAPPIHLCLVIDRSTSMSGDRMDMVKASTLNLLKQLRPKDYFSIVAFGDRADVIVAPIRFSDSALVLTNFSLLTPGGGTEIYQGLDQGIRLLREHLNPEHSRHLVLITDGHTYGDEEKCLQAAQAAAQDKISISALGIGHEWNDTFLDELTAFSGNSAFLVKDPQSISQFLSEKIKSLENIYARGLSLDFLPESENRLQYAFRIFPEPGVLPVASPIPLGDLYYQGKIVFLLEFLVNSIREEVQQVVLADAQIRMEIASGSHKAGRIWAHLFRKVQTNIEPEKPPEPVIEAISKLTLYRMQEKARQEVINGEIRQATRRLQHLATHLLSQGERELARTVLVEAQYLQINDHYSQDGDKQIKYGTRALLLPVGKVNSSG
ncbi:MAG TPA: VWA domain-containing protein [Anaerolineaceae bacterium]